MIYQEIIDHFGHLANPEIAGHSQRFFKTAKGEYGFGDKFIGIRVPKWKSVIPIYTANVKFLIGSSEFKHTLRKFFRKLSDAH